MLVGRRVSEVWPWQNLHRFTKGCRRNIRTAQDSMDSRENWLGFKSKRKASEKTLHCTHLQARKEAAWFSHPRPSFGSHYPRFKWTAQRAAHDATALQSSVWKERASSRRDLQVPASCADAKALSNFVLACTTCKHPSRNLRSASVNCSMTTTCLPVELSPVSAWRGRLC